MNYSSVIEKCSRHDIFSISCYQYLGVSALSFIHLCCYRNLMWHSFSAEKKQTDSKNDMTQFTLCDTTYLICISVTWS